jgi:Ca2+-binding EF-hand superfamily protein
VYISVAEFRAVLHGIRLSVTDAELYQLLRRFDTADDGRVNYTEFCACFADALSPGVRVRLVPVGQGSVY